MVSCPRLVIWIITARCNLACRHCYAARLLNGELSASEARELAEKIAQSDVRHVNITGGEPLIREDLIDIIKLLSETGTGVSIVTNATLLNERIAKELYKYDVYAYVSLDGVRAETHEYIRGSGAWEKVMKGLRFLKEAGVEYALVMSVNSLNYKEAGLFVEKAVELGADHAAIIPVMKVGRASEELAAKPREYFEAMRLADEKSSEYGFFISYWCTPFAKLVVKSKYAGWWYCRTIDVMDVAPDGSVMLCDILDFKTTTVKGVSIEEAWKKHCEHPLSKLVENPPIPEPCKKCPIKDKCRGGCFARAYLEYGSLTAPDPLCPLVVEHMEGKKSEAKG